LANFRLTSSTAPAEKWLVKKYSTPSPAPTRKKNAASALTAGEFSRPTEPEGWRKTPTRLRLNG